MVFFDSELFILGVFHGILLGCAPAAVAMLFLGTIKLIKIIGG